MNTISIKNILKVMCLHLLIGVVYFPSQVMGQQNTTSKDGYTVTINVDRPEAVYKRGEKITFTIKLTKDNKPINGAKLKYFLSKDGVVPYLEEKFVTAEKGVYALSGVLNEPGFLQCRVDFDNQTKRKLVVWSSAAVDPLEIKPSMAAPDDFDEFWAEQKKILAAIPMNVKMTVVECSDKSIECFDVQADSFKAPMSGYYARPAGAKKGSLPAIICLHGAGVASSRLSIVTGWAKEGVIALDFNAHGQPNGQPRKFYKDLNDGELHNYRFFGRESRETIFYRGLFMRLMRAMDVLTAQPEWDGKILIAHGRSQGGGQAIAAGGLNPLVTFVCAEIPTFCDHTGFVAGRINGWPKLIVMDENGKPDQKMFQAACYYDSMNFAARTDAEAFLTVGFVDVSCPPTGVYAAYNIFRNKKNIFNMPCWGHRVVPEANTAVREAILNYLKKGK